MVRKFFHNFFMMGALMLVIASVVALFLAPIMLMTWAETAGLPSVLAFAGALVLYLAAFAAIMTYDDKKKGK